jgi:17beta-estradiol 17-dehydrogenase / very-long-chain 3-oxoacyl-CoA reductase
LALELAEFNIQVQTINAYFVVSNMSKIHRPSFLAPLASDYVHSVLSVAGRTSELEITPHPSHALIQYGMSWLPRHFLLAYTHRLHKIMREKAIRKQLRSQKSE